MLCDAPTLKGGWPLAKPMGNDPPVPEWSQPCKGPGDVLLFGLVLHGTLAGAWSRQNLLLPGPPVG